jgi:hypothetical protein
MRSVRDFRYPEDLGVFFNFACAPRVKLPEELENEIGEILARAVGEDYHKTAVRWAKVRTIAGGDHDPSRFRASVVSIGDRRVFTFARVDLNEFWSHEGRLVEIGLERTAAGMPEAASAIAGLASECLGQAARIEIWRYNEQHPPTPYTVNRYLTLEDLARRLNLQMFAERASTRDSPTLRKYLRDQFVLRSHSSRTLWCSH